MYFLTVLGCWVMCQIIHECGHIILLLKYGYKIRGISIGLPIKPFVTIPIKFDNFNMSLYFSPYLWSSMTITNMETKPKASIWTAIVLAGPSACILVLVVIYLFNGMSGFMYLANSLWQNPGRRLSFWEWFIILNFACGFGELVPFVSNDGTRLLQVLRDKYFQKTRI